MAAFEEEKQARIRATVKAQSVANSILTPDGVTEGVFLIRFNSPFNRGVSVGLILSVLWTMLYVPYLLAFRRRLGDIPLVPALINCGVDIFYLISLILRRFTSVCDLTYGKEWCQSRDIRRHILKSTFFWLDLISVLPLCFAVLPPYVSQIRPGATTVQEVGVITDAASSESPRIPFSQQPFFPWRCVHLLALLRAHRLIFVPVSHLEAQYNIRVHISRLILWVYMLCHVVGCLWFLVLEENGTVELHAALSSDVGAAPLWAERGGPGSASWWYLFALRDGVYVLAGRQRAAYSRAEMLFLAVSGPTGSFFFCHHCCQLHSFVVPARRGRAQTPRTDVFHPLRDEVSVSSLGPSNAY